MRAPIAAKYPLHLRQSPSNVCLDLSRSFSPAFLPLRITVHCIRDKVLQKWTNAWKPFPLFVLVLALPFPLAFGLCLFRGPWLFHADLRFLLLLTACLLPGHVIFLHHPSSTSSTSSYFYLLSKKVYLWRRRGHVSTQNRCQPVTRKQHSQPKTTVEPLFLLGAETMKKKAPLGAR